MLTDLQSVFAGDIQELLGPTVQVVNLTGEAIDLGLGKDSHERSKNTGNPSEKTFVSGKGGIWVREDVRKGISSDG